MDDAARRGHRARELRPGPDHRLFRRGHAGCARAAALRAPKRRPATPVSAWRGSFALAVGLFSGGRPNRRRRHFIMRNAGNAQQSRSAGGPAMTATPAPPSTRTRTRRRRASSAQRSRPRAHAGRRHSASTSSTGTTSGPAETPRDRARLRPLGRLTRVPGLRLGRDPRGQHGRRPATDYLTNAPPAAKVHTVGSTAHVELGRRTT